MEHEPINTFIQTLSQWGVHERDYKGQDYITTLCILGLTIGDKDIAMIRDFTRYQLFEYNLKQYLINLVEKQHFKETFLVISLSNYLLNWLSNSGESLLRQVNMCESLLEEYPESKSTWEPMLKKAKSIETEASFKDDYYRWQLLSIQNLGQRQIDIWDAEELQETAKKIPF